MKKISFSVVAVTLGLSMSAGAQTWFPWEEDFGSGMPLEERIDYLSWCEDNKVMSSGSTGEVVTKADCSRVSNQAKCVEKTVRKADILIVSASCQ